jgi:hypothetical protein
MLMYRMTITKAVSSSKLLERVMIMAGCANPTTTMIYLHGKNRMKDPVEV